MSILILLFVNLYFIKNIKVYSTSRYKRTIKTMILQSFIFITPEYDLHFSNNNYIHVPHIAKYN